MSAVDARGGGRAWVVRYLLAAHASRVVVASFALYVAARTTNEIPVAGTLSVALAAAGVAWTLALALAWRPLDRLLARWPRLVWLDAAVLTGLMLVDKPWDAMIAVPYGAFLLLVVYGSPLGILALTAAMALVQYAPKLVLSAVDWRYAELCPPVNSADWLTAYVGPVFAGTICWALCVLVSGVRRASAEWDEAQAALTEAYIRRADARARRALADRLHETISQAVRAIPLRLDGHPGAELEPEALRLREEIAAFSLRLRPRVQSAARRLRADDGASSPSSE